MKLIPCGRGFETIVDDEDYCSLSQYKWHCNIKKDGSKVYVMRVSRKAEAIKKTKFYLHRLIMCPASGLFIDHINGNGLDNRRCNLRIVTPFQNQGNRRKLKGGLYKGVRVTKYGTYRCSVRHGKKTYHLGTFKTQEDCAKAYDNYARNYFGEYAYTNF